jgi:hypothetical protein
MAHSLCYNSRITFPSILGLVEKKFPTYCVWPISAYCTNHCVQNNWPGQTKAVTCTNTAWIPFGLSLDVHNKKTHFMPHQITK